ncbi:energy transducer TonB [Campylobacter sp. faydin G-24]|uniref:Energy transducer TonB n=1 Tax=Campylobacter anatolicus TaxID=2829105 RepID=A0ABS5HGD0_9BACT|nr:energy transducer TonB [Campylobacter anatolicus]MBR8463157.1 energy transducer TonB [Campylobacter anatolicus]
MVNFAKRYNNAISFSLSLALHSVFFGFGLYATKNNILMADRHETTKVMSIKLSQISNNNSQDELQASQKQAEQSILAQAVQEVKPPNYEPEPIIEDIKEIKEITKTQDKIVKDVVKKPILKKPKPKKQLEIVKKKCKDHNEPSRKASTPASQSVANNETVNDGGSKQSGVLDANKQATAKTILGEVQAAILKHKTYPKRAKDGDMKGKIFARFKLKGYCEFEILKITKGSGYAFLDKHTLNIITNACKDFPLEAIGMDIMLPINFNLHKH